MKKAIAILLALMLVVSMAPAAFASTTTLTINVPNANYEFSIPADTTIEFNALDTSIGCVQVTQSSGFAEGKNLQINVAYDDFTSESVSSTIPYTLKYARVKSENATEAQTTHDHKVSKLTFVGQNDGTVSTLASYTDANDFTYYIGDLGVVITPSAWGRALGGEYTSTITFTAEVVLAD